MHDLQPRELSQPSQQSFHDLAPLLDRDELVFPHECFKGISVGVFHRKIDRVLSLIHAVKRDDVGIFYSSHEFDLVLNCRLPFSLVRDFLHEGLHGYFTAASHIFRQVDSCKVASPNLPQRPEELMEIPASDVLEQQCFPFLIPEPEISLESDAGLSEAELQANRFSVFSLEEGKIESELEWYGPMFVLLDESEFVGVEEKVGELSLDHEGVRNKVFGVVGGLQGGDLFTLHRISIHQFSNCRI
jgi:hypothetical protein